MITTKKQNGILVAELLQKFFVEHKDNNSVGLKEENLPTFFTMFDEILDTFLDSYFRKNVSALLGMEYKSRINNFGFLSGFVPEEVFKSNSTFKSQFYPAYFKELFEVTEIEHSTLPKNYVTLGKTEMIKEFLTKENLEKVLDGGKKFHTDRTWRNIFQIETFSKVIKFVYENFEEDEIATVLTEIVFPLLKQVQEDEIQSTGHLPFLYDSSKLSDSQKMNVIEFVFVELMKSLEEEKVNDDNIFDFTSRLRFYFTHNSIQDLPKVVDSYYQVDGSSFKVGAEEFFPQIEQGKFISMLNLKREVSSIDTVEILMDTFEDSLHTTSYFWKHILILSEPNGVRELFRFLTQNNLKLKVPKYFTFEDGQGTMTVKVDQLLL